MTFLQALAYFVREALSSLRRSLKVSLLAVVTIAVSLTVGGVFLLVGSNLSRMAEEARDQSQVVLYLAEDSAEGRAEEIAEELRTSPQVRTATVVSTEEAGERFREIFPSLAELVEGEQLPPSVELALVRTPETADDGGSPGSTAPPPGSAAYDAWLAELGAIEGVELVDDDRDWLRQMGAIVTLVHGLGLALGGILLGAAVFTIASVIRLTAYLYHDEIAVMRLVGATEFYIRGPFYMEGVLQGLLGSVAATGALAVGWALFTRQAGESMVTSVLLAEFLGPRDLAFLLALGPLAGLVGAIVSLRRERLGEPPEEPEGDEAESL